MAKTLIGNVKGKDGRGISKIEKTATTGSVDTYTIVYTDGTESTYEVENSDSVAIQRQIVPSAAVESSATASQAYIAGDYVVVGGVLRKVTSSIAKGSTIGDSNSTATTVTGEIKTVQDSVSHAKILAGPKIGRFMSGNQTVNLSELVSQQAHGIVLCWCAYENDKPQDYNNFYTFIPKSHVAIKSGQGVLTTMSNVKFGRIGAKYVYVSDSRVTGIDDNKAYGTSNGVTFDNRQWVLDAVIGV